MPVVEFEMTRKHIRNGTAGSCRSCPAALCLQEALPFLGAVLVGSSSISLYRLDLGSSTENDLFEVETPENLKRFIDDFDEGNSVEPIDFDLDVPLEVLAWAG